MTDEVHGALSHLVLSSEAVWGTTDGSPVWVHMPCFDYGVRFRPERRNAQPYIGLRQRKHGKTVKGMPSGTLQAALYGQIDSGPSVSLAQYLLDWAFLNPEEVLALPSKSAQWIEGPGVSDKIHTGLRVNQATLTGSDQSGIWEISLDLMGQDEALLDSEDIEAVPNDREKIQEFEYCESTFTLAGSGANLAAVQYQASNNLEINYLGSSRPSLITAGDRVDTLQLTLVKNSDTYDAYRRSQAMNEFAFVLKIRGLHNGTGANSYSYATLTFPRCQYADHEDQRSFQTLTKSPLQLDVLKPDDGNPAVSIAYGTEA